MVGSVHFALQPYFLYNGFIASHQTIPSGAEGCVLASQQTSFADTAKRIAAVFTEPHDMAAVMHPDEETVHGVTLHC